MSTPSPTPLEDALPPPPPSGALTDDPVTAAVTANVTAEGNVSVAGVELAVPPVSEATPRPRAARAYRVKRVNTLAAWAFLLPNLSGFLVFTFLPVLASAALSLYDWNLYSAPKFVGLKNFVNLLGFHPARPDASGALLAGFLVCALGSLLVGGFGLVQMFRAERRRAAWSALAFLALAGLLFAVGRLTWREWRPNDLNFWKYFYNTVFMMGAIPFDLLASLLLALMLNQKLRGLHIFRLIYFLPSIVVGVGTFILWKWLYQPQDGAFNVLLQSVGLPPAPWLNSPGWAKPALMLMGFWSAVGGTNMILYLAALQNVPPELLEAAEIDGATAFQKFWAVTWPSVRPTTFFIFTMSLIGGFQAGFEAAFTMTGGGPAGGDDDVELLHLQRGFREQQHGLRGGHRLVPVLHRLRRHHVELPLRRRRVGGLKQPTFPLPR